MEEKEVVEQIYDIKERSADIYEHSISTCSLDMLVALKMQLDRETVHDIGVGCLLHDLGLRYITVNFENTSLDDLSDKELDEYLDKLNHEGCGYASIVNSVFEYYENAENGEELFRKKFGFDMKRSDGTMNFELLLVYVYSKYDDPKSKGLSQKSPTESCLHLV